MAVKSFAKKGFTPSPGIVKQASNVIPRWLIVNSAAAGVAILMTVLAVRGIMHKDVAPQCSDRFANGTLFGLQNKSGAPIGAPDLQARLAGRDWGLLENLKLVSLKDGPAPVAMQIALPKLAPKPDDEVQPKSGMGFTWLVPSIAQASAACLTYNIMLPEDFTFGMGGILPGLFGGETTELPSATTTGGFVVRNSWGEKGMARARAVTAADQRGASFQIDPDGLQLPRGRWVRIEQELVLNQSGASDGILRLWVDGKLYHEDLKFAARNDERAQFRGVIADVHYGMGGQVLTAVPKSTSIQVTPFELRWQ
jgi:hypothetical protein